MLDDLVQTGLQVLMVAHAEQVIPQMISKGTVVFAGGFRNFIEGGALTGKQIKRFAG